MGAGVGFTAEHVGPAVNCSTLAFGCDDKRLQRLEGADDAGGGGDVFEQNEKGKGWAVSDLRRLLCSHFIWKGPYSSSCTRGTQHRERQVSIWVAERWICREARMNVRW